MKTLFNQDNLLNLTNSWRRLTNLIIDIGLIRLFCAILIYQNFRLFDNAAIYFFVYFFVILCLYYFIMELTLGKTIGKFFTGTKVVNLNGGKPNSSEIAIRTLCRFIPFELFTFLNSKAVGLHDSLSKTRVVFDI